MTESLANQIAAGEVVERPASCMKELIENSLDAGAKNIFTTIEDGGITSIIVQDDGSGMDESDALLAFSRHATSKLRHTHDLFRIQTLGFRGEALASIAAVAKIDMRTRTRDAEYGCRVVGEGSQLTSQVEPTASPVGTRIEVKDLFFNTPARLKYLRSVTTEQARCLEVVQRAALSRPDVAFRMDVNRHVAFQTTGNGKVQDVLATLYGVGEARQMLAVNVSNADYQLTGYVGRPTQGRASRSHGTLFINARPIRNLTLHQAVTAGYQGRLMINRQPMYALYLHMDPTLVDVNIHPHKAEVRFSEERDVARLVQSGVENVLAEAFLVPTIPLESKPLRTREGEQGKLQLDSTNDTALVQAREKSVAYPNQPVGLSRNHNTVHNVGQSGEAGQAQEIRRKPGRIESRHSSVSPQTARAFLDSALGTAHPEVAPTTAPPSDGRETTRHSRPSGREVVVNANDTQEAEQTARRDEPSTQGRVNLAKLRLIGQALGVYILADDGESLYIIDQHAAHERVLYEKFTDRMQAAEVHAVTLLAPIQLTLSPTARALLDSAVGQFQEIGLEFDDFGGQDVILRTIPDIWEGLDAAGLVEGMIENLSSHTQEPDVLATLREVVVLRACKAAIKANHRLSVMEMEALCEALPGLRDPYHCPHGRPVFIRLSNRDLEKGFRRIV